MSRRRQRGGDTSSNDLSQLHLWGQDQVPPGSYKIQLGYVQIPKTVELEEKWLDTPYRFKSFHDADSEANRIFDGYRVRIVGSNDHPYWDAPSYFHETGHQVKQDQRWYDVVGLEPSARQKHNPTRSPTREMTMTPER